MRKIALLPVLTLILSLFSGCQPRVEAQIAATTLPVYEFTQRICQGTDITVTRLVTESVSCLHDYSLSVSQAQAAEAAEVIICSGMGLEDFMEDIIHNAPMVIDCSQGITAVECHHHHDHDHGHHHETDPHIWLDPLQAKVMAQNIYQGLSQQYPQHQAQFQSNLNGLLTDLDTLYNYGVQTLSALNCRELITFHDGFAYMAEAFDLHILKTVEEESGSEASAQDLIELITLVREHQLPAIFTETNGSSSAAQIISAETDVPVYTLDMAMAGNDYFGSMYHNINTLKEALG